MLSRLRRPSRCLCKMMLVSFNSNTNAFSGGAETAFPSRVPEFTLFFFVGFVLLNIYFIVQCFVSSGCLFIPFLFLHCVVCPSWIYGLWSPFLVSANVNILTTNLYSMINYIRIVMIFVLSRTPRYYLSRFKFKVVISVKNQYI